MPNGRFLPRDALRCRCQVPALRHPDQHRCRVWPAFQAFSAVPVFIMVGGADERSARMEDRDMVYARLPREPIADQVATAYRWITDERPGWPFARALPAWLAYEADYDWDPDDADDAVAFGRWFDACVAEANRREWV
jgi:hypothetical protein